MLIASIGDAPFVALVHPPLGNRRLCKHSHAGFSRLPRRLHKVWDMQPGAREVREELVDLHEHSRSRQTAPFIAHPMHAG